MQLRRNIVANYLAQAWIIIMGLAFVPTYIKYLGIEVYGLIGLFVLLQSLMPLLDMGMSPALSREMAKSRGSMHDGMRIRDLLRSLELIYVGLAAFIGLTIWCTSDWIATVWLKTGNLSPPEVSYAIALMGVVISLRFLESIYSGSLAGLQRQVTLSWLNAGFATVRGAGTVSILVFVSPTVAAFFLWQAAVSIFSLLTLAAILYASLPATERSARFSIDALREIRRFAAGMAGIGVLSLVLTHIDKFLLSTLLPLNEFGYYMLAANVAGFLYVVASPVGQAFLPRFVELLEKKDQAGLAVAYHKAAQLITVSVGAVALILIFFGDTVLHLWTRDLALAQQTSPILAVLSLGILLNCLMWIPYQMQIAHGIVSIALRTNIVAILFIVPGVYIAVKLLGPIGAAWVWVLLNIGYMIIPINLMYRRLLKSERMGWYIRDLVIPLTLPVVVCYVGHLVLPQIQSRIVEFVFLAFLLAALLCIGGLCASHIRSMMYVFSARAGELLRNASFAR